jgi:hypothetical protein
MIFISISNLLFASVVKGKIYDAKSSEELVGAAVYIKELKLGTVSGLDGSYFIKNVPKGNYTILCSYISYQTIERKQPLNSQTSGF